MVTLKPFQAIRPIPELAEKVAALPYDVLSRQEAKEKAEKNPYSFLHIDKAEIDVEESLSPYDERVYEKARENLEKMIGDGIFIQEKEANFYIYQLSCDTESSQTGIVGCASVEEYKNNKIKKHERTREEKLRDRIQHIDTCHAQTGPIFLAYPTKKEITDLAAWWKRNNLPIYNFIADDGVKHTVWVVNNELTISNFQKLFEEVPAFYIADGHHRAEAAVQVGLSHGKEKGMTGGHFLSVAFPHEELEILDYNRVVADLNGHSPEEFLDKVKKIVSVEEWGERYQPKEKGSIGMYLSGRWYRLAVEHNEEDIVERLDVSILQSYLLAPVLGIENPSVDQRISFVGGIRGLGELERLVDSEEYRVAFSLYPPTMEELLQVADEGKMMPPKSTWFEPKLRSGLFIHRL